MIPKKQETTVSVEKVSPVVEKIVKWAVLNWGCERGGAQERVGHKRTGSSRSRSTASNVPCIAMTCVRLIVLLDNGVSAVVQGSRRQGAGE